MADRDPHLWVTILAGGVGARFWPASTASRPKPLLALASDRPLIRETVDRAVSIVEPERVRIVTNREVAASFESVLSELNPSTYWIEPSSRGTAPALTWAAHRIASVDPDAVLVSFHSDHRVEPESALAGSVTAAVETAREEDRLLTLAVTPVRPEIGYGYLRPGARIGGARNREAFQIDGFVEKPDLEAARSHVSSGYLWNTGIFVLPVRRFLEEIRLHAPEIGEHLPLLDQGDVTSFFEAVPSISIDEAVFERSDRTAALQADFRWDDLGNWESLTRSWTPDANGNWTLGRVHSLDSHDSIIWAEDGPIVLFGVEGLVVVRAGGATLVTTRARSPDLKRLVLGLPTDLLDGPEAQSGPLDEGRSSGGGETDG